MRISTVRLLLVLFLILLGGVFTQCVPMEQKGELLYSPDGKLIGPVGGNGLSSIEAYKRTVYPISRKNCVACHTVNQPVHADPNPQVAHDSLLSLHKVNLQNPSKSSLIKKLETGHECGGNCQALINEYVEAIEEWVALMNKDDGGGKDGGSGGPDLSQYDNLTDASNTIYQEMVATKAAMTTRSTNINQATLTAPMVSVSGTPNYLHVPLRNPQQTFNLNAANTGVASFDFNGTGTNITDGKIWGLANIPNDLQNSFHISMGGINADWRIPTTNGKFKWVTVTNGQNQANINYTLSAAANTLRVQESTSGAQISKLTWVNNAEWIPSGDGTIGTALLKFPLNEILNIPNSFLKVRVEDFDQYSYRLSNLSIEVPGKAVRVKNIKLLMNDVFSPQFSNFTFIDTTTPTGGGPLSPGIMIALKDEGLNVDKFRFAFETLSITADPDASLNAFQNTVWPLSKANCINCHATNPNRVQHASPTASIAHNDVIDSSIVDFANPENSAIVNRMKAPTRHNCGNDANCDSLAAQFEASIIQWKQATQDN